MLKITFNEVRRSWSRKKVVSKTSHSHAPLELLLPPSFTFVRFWSYKRAEERLYGGFCRSSRHKQKYFRKTTKRNPSLVYEFPYFSIWLVKLRIISWLRSGWRLLRQSHNSHFFLPAANMKCLSSAPDALVKQRERLNYAFILLCATSPRGDGNILKAPPPDACRRSQPTKFYHRP